MSQCSIDTYVPSKLVFLISLDFTETSVHYPFFFCYLILKIPLTHLSSSFVPCSHDSFDAFVLSSSVPWFSRFHWQDRPPFLLFHSHDSTDTSVLSYFNNLFSRLTRLAIYCFRILKILSSLLLFMVFQDSTDTNVFPRNSSILFLDSFSFT